MESFTHESDESSSCTQSDGDSTNSSNGTNPFLLCPRPNSSLHLHLGGQGRTHDTTEDTRPFKLARMEPPHHRQYHASAVANPLGANSLQYPHNMVGAIHGADGLHSSALLSQNRSYASTALEDCRIPAAQAASAARSHHGSLPYLGPTQAFLTPDQWAELRQQTYMLKHVATCNNAPPALLLPMGCKVENVPVNFGSNAGSYFLGLADPQPGRCRRTDGKKWRCGRAVVPDQKYCERHMHRGRGRSKAARLAKVNTPVDGNQPLNSARPLNQPLIQLLNQLAVPVQPLNQPPEPVQKPPIPAQPLQWLANPSQPFLQPHAHLPFLSQPLQAEPLSQVPNPSKPLDWPLNQTPMEAEPLNIVHAYGVPPNLAQAIPINAASEIKSTSITANGARIPEGRRVQADDHDDVFTLDVQGIKRLLENAPCSKRFKKFANQHKQLPNVADLLNVAHFRSPSNQPKRPPSLMDVLKMVDPGTATITTTTTTTTSTSLINHHLQCTTKDNGALPVNCNQAGIDLPAREHTGAPLSLRWSDEQIAEEKTRKYSSSTAILSGSLDLIGARQENDPTLLTSFKVKHEKEEGEEGADQRIAECDIKGGCSTRVDGAKTRGPSTSVAEGCENHTRVESPSLVKESPDCFESSAVSEKTTFNSLENRKENSAKFSKSNLSLVEAHVTPTDETSPSLVKESLNRHKHTVKLDINSLDAEGEGYDHLISSKESQPKSIEPRESSSKHHESFSESKRGSLHLLERTLDCCEMAVKPEKRGVCLTGKSQAQYDPSASPHSNHPISVRKSTEFQENPVSLDMNSPPILAKESLELHGGSDELQRNSTGLGSSTRVLQIKATFDRSPSDNSCNVNSNSKSTLILEPVGLNSTEPLSQVSLAT